MMIMIVMVVVVVVTAVSQEKNPPLHFVSEPTSQPTG